MSKPSSNSLLRKQVWEHWIGPTIRTSMCWCCAVHSISDNGVNGWEMGHFISAKDGGQKTKDNLRPVCRECNGAMTTNDLLSFARSHEYTNRWPGNRLKSEEEYLRNYKRSLKEGEESDEESDYVSPKKAGESDKGVKQDVEQGDAKSAVAETKKEDCSILLDDLLDTSEPGAFLMPQISIDFCTETKSVTAEDVENYIATMPVDDVVPFKISGVELMRFLKTTQRFVGNRDVDPVKVEELLFACKEEFKATNSVDLRCVPISVALTPGRKTNFNRWLLDGAHRTEMLKQFDELKSVKAILWIRRLKSESELDVNFRKINSGTPVPPAYYEKRTARVLDDFLMKVSNRYPGVVKSDEYKQAQRPCFLRRNVRDSLSKSETIRKGIEWGIITANTLLERLISDNEEWKNEKSKEYLTKNYDIKESMWKKAKDFDFFMGLNRTWYLTFESRLTAYITSKRKK